jgi:hypothetical protein
LINSLKQLLSNSPNLTTQLLNDFKDNPLNENSRLKLSQLFSEIYLLTSDVQKSLLPYQAKLKCSQVFENFFISFEPIFMVLTPLNISYTKVEVIFKMIQTLSDLMLSSKFDPQWIEKISNRKDELKVLLPLFKEASTVGFYLHHIQIIIINVLQDVSYIEAHLPSSDQTTIPLIIELMVPALKNCLVTSYVDDSFEECEHLFIYSTLQLSIAKFLTILANVLEYPEIIYQDSIFLDCKKINILNSYYTQIVNLRRNFFLNPFTFSYYSKIRPLMNSFLLSFASLIAPVENISSTLQNEYLKFVLADVFLYIFKFIEACERVNIRPYRELPTPNSIA